MRADALARAKSRAKARKTEALTGRVFFREPLSPTAAFTAARDAASQSTTKLGAAHTFQLLNPRVALNTTQLRAAMEAIEREPCTQKLHHGTFGQTWRACQVLETHPTTKRNAHGAGATCQDCFVFKRAREKEMCAAKPVAAAKTKTKTKAKAKAKGSLASNSASTSTSTSTSTAPESASLFTSSASASAEGEAAPCLGGILKRSEGVYQKTLVSAMGRAPAARSHGAQHVPRILHMLTDRERPSEPSRFNKHPEDNILLIMDDVRPFVSKSSPSKRVQRIASLMDLALAKDAHSRSKITDSVWRKLWLQLIGTLADAADAVPGFRHNDLHANNVLIEDTGSAKGGALQHACSFTRADGSRLSCESRLCVKVIDFGDSSSDARPAQSDQYASLRYPFAIMDVHHAAAGIFKLANSDDDEDDDDDDDNNNNKWYDEWADFMTDIFTPSLFNTDTWNRFHYPVECSCFQGSSQCLCSKPLKDSVRRLSWITEYLQMLDPHGHNPVRAILSHPYFDEFSTEQRSAHDAHNFPSPAKAFREQVHPVLARETTRARAPSPQRAPSKRASGRASPQRKRKSASGRSRSASPSPSPSRSRSRKQRDPRRDPRRNSRSRSPKRKQ